MSQVPMSPLGKYGSFNIHMGWIVMVMGILTGSVLGLWSFAGPFPTPPGHENYTDLPRRMNRLAHIALFALPMINILYGSFIDRVPLTDSQKHLGSRCMVVCMIGVPLFLFLGSMYLPFKYAEIIPVGAGTIALGLMSWGNFKALRSGSAI